MKYTKEQFDKAMEIVQNAKFEMFEGDEWFAVDEVTDLNLWMDDTFLYATIYNVENGGCDYRDFEQIWSSPLTKIGDKTNV